MWHPLCALQGSLTVSIAAPKARCHACTETGEAGTVISLIGTCLYPEGVPILMFTILHGKSAARYVRGTAVLHVQTM